MKPLYMFGPCECNSEGQISIKALLLEEIRPNMVVFTDICLGCDKTQWIGFEYDQMNGLDQAVKYFDDWLDTPESDECMPIK